MKKIVIPNYAELVITNVVLDYNGTLASNGFVSSATRETLRELSQLYRVFVITADTFGTVKDELSEFDLEIIVLSSNNHTKEKAELIATLGSDRTIAMGNGNNDALMLKHAVVSLSIMGSEGCSGEALASADIVCGNIVDAMELLIHEKRLIATLRK